MTLTRALIVGMALTAAAPGISQQPAPAAPVSRNWVLFFDAGGGMTPSDLARATQSSLQWVDSKMTATDRVAVVMLSSTLGIAADFSTDRTVVRHAIETVATTSSAESLTDHDRARALSTICGSMASLTGHRAILFFSLGLPGPSDDLRAAFRDCARSDVSINPVDVRGLSQNPPVPLGPGVVAPIVTQRVSPKYTSAALRARQEGDVGLEIVVRADGTVGDVKVTKSLNPELDEQAILAAKQWTFTPGTLNGQNVSVMMQVTVEFRIH